MKQVKNAPPQPPKVVPTPFPELPPRLFSVQDANMIIQVLERQTVEGLAGARDLAAFIKRFQVFVQGAIDSQKRAEK